MQFSSDEDDFEEVVSEHEEHEAANVLNQGEKMQFKQEGELGHERRRGEDMRCGPNFTSLLLQKLWMPSTARMITSRLQRQWCS